MMLYFTQLASRSTWMVLLLLPLWAYNQIYDFSTNMPYGIWLGDTSQYTINNRILLNGSLSPATIYFPKQTGILGTYQLEGKYNSEPSSSNYTKWFLYSNSPHPSDATLALYLKLGGASGTSDKLELYATINQINTKLWTSSTGLTSLDFQILFRITEDSVYYEINHQGFATALILPSAFRTYTPTNYLGLSCTFTSTKKNLFELKSLQYIPQKEKLILSAPTNHTFYLSSARSNIQSLIRIESKPSVLWSTTALNDTSFLLSYPSEAIIDTLQLTVTLAFQDNTEATFNYHYIRPIEYYPGIIRITEVMSDPSPSKGVLPEYEYIELYNTSKQNVSLNGWKIQDNSQQLYALPTISIGAQQIIIFTSEEACLKLQNPNCIGVQNLPTLNNDTDYLKLLNQKDEIMDSIIYAVESSNPKSDGGYSFEASLQTFACHYGGSLHYTLHQNGGTPFEIAPTDFTFQYQTLSLDPYLMNTNYFGSLQFKGYDTTYYALNNIYPPFEVALGSSIYHEITYQPNCPFLDTTYVAEILLERPCAPSPGELLLNEVLFNPKPYHAEFIELYNNSSKLLLLKDVILLYEDERGKKEITLKPFHLNAYSYMVVSKDTSRLFDNNQNTASLLSLLQNDLPSLDDASFSLTLLTNGTIIDHVSLHKNQHNPLLTEVEGVSLEKTIPDLPSDAAIWTSAAEQSSPGQANSQLLQHFQHDNVIDCQPTHLFQNQAGQPHFMQISFKNNLLGAFYSAQIYSLEGQLIKTLTPSSLSKGNDTLLWYGDNNQSSPIETGIYLLIIETWDSQGQTHTYKKLISTSN
jgi:hypothetical protein